MASAATGNLCCGSKSRGAKGWCPPALNEEDACVRAESLQLSNSLQPHQAPLPKEVSRQEYWSGLPFPPPRDLLDPGIKLAFLKSPALAGGLFTTSATWEALN